MKRKKENRFFTLLEVMVAIAILAIAGGAMYWRVDRWLEVQRFKQDTNRLESFLLYAQALAINTHADWQVVIESGKEGCKVRILCVEDPERLNFAKQPSPLHKGQLYFNHALTNRVIVDFFSTGHVAPTGVLTLRYKESKREFLLPQLFRQEENPTCRN
ncbi:MAG: prepilin-type N-terminal cleavage/methylation domain-containing protein [Verrucomicrobiota bacterium]|nr:prepilin-type N-terminal cleavage/methylation domain-containing protein [Verrucomicrobiota bacterium]